MIKYGRIHSWAMRIPIRIAIEGSKIWPANQFPLTEKANFSTQIIFAYFSIRLHIRPPNPASANIPPFSSLPGEVCVDLWSSMLGETGTWCGKLGLERVLAAKTVARLQL